MGAEHGDPRVRLAMPVEPGVTVGTDRLYALHAGLLY